jgi:hypothetical protein
VDDDGAAVGGVSGALFVSRAVAAARVGGAGDRLFDALAPLPVLVAPGAVFEIGAGVP